MAVGHIGLLTTLIENLATTIGAGALVGSFAIGTVGLISGRPRQALEQRVLTDGYLGGICGLLAAVIDLVVRYAG